MKLKDCLLTLNQLTSKGYSTQNNMITRVDVDTIAHFGNVNCLEIECEHITPYHSFNNTRNLGYLIRALVVLFEQEREDGVRLSEIKNVPCRLVFNTSTVAFGSRAIGIGHYMKDKFILFEDFYKIDE